MELTEQLVEQPVEGESVLVRHWSSFGADNYLNLYLFRPLPTLQHDTWDIHFEDFRRNVWLREHFQTEAEAQARCDWICTHLEEALMAEVL